MQKQIKIKSNCSTMNLDFDYYINLLGEVEDFMTEKYQNEKTYQDELISMPIGKTKTLNDNKGVEL